MACLTTLLIGLCAVLSITLVISILNQRAKNRLAILMMLLENEERWGGNPLELCYGHDPRALQKLLITMTNQGFLDRIIIVHVTAKREPSFKAFYKLTPGGLQFARKLRVALRHRNN